MPRNFDCIAAINQIIQRTFKEPNCLFRLAFERTCSICDTYKVLEVHMTWCVIYTVLALGFLRGLVP